MSTTDTSVRTPVLLRVWGRTETDARAAEDDARNSTSAAYWTIAEVIRHTGDSCPLTRTDPAAIRSGSDYGRAWNAYRAGT